MNRARLKLLTRKFLEWSSLGFLIFLFVAPLCMLAWLIFFTKTFSVVAVTIVDAKQNTQTDIRNIAEKYVGENILFLQTDQIQQQILRDVPQVRDVHIVRKLLGTMKIIVQEKTPALLLVSNGSYYFVDEEGIAYANASLDLLPGVVLPTVKTADADANVTLGARAVDASFVDFITEIQTELPDIAHAQIVEMSIPSLAAREVHFFLDRNWKIMMDTTRNAKGQLSILSRLLTSTVPEEEQQTLTYIDLRIPNRVYYK